MTWFERQRLDWIAESLRIYGFINRDHLMRKFGISMPQASKDLQTYQRRNPNHVRYNLSSKRYEIATPASPSASSLDAAKTTPQ